MGKIVDLTEKLGMAEKPQIKIGDTTLTVNDSAKTMLRVMELFDGEPGPKELLEACGLIFEPKSKKALDSLELSFKDFQIVIMTAIDVVVGGMDEGNALTPATI